MHTQLNVFQMANALATYAGRRQAVIARNIANADTPGYRAQDLAPFSEQVQQGRISGEAQVLRDAPADANGNSVSVELEMLRAVDARRQHDRAIAIYRSSLNVLRTALGRN